MKHENHKAETKAVRQALKKAGINAKVSHGRGTGWGWLEINIGNGSQWGEHLRFDDSNYGPCRHDCPRCQKVKEYRQKTLRIAKEVTDRHGEYDGNILVLTQDHWNEKKGQSEPIIQLV